MEFIGWIWWAILKVIGLAWGIVWFLLGGWVATLAQIGVIAFLIFGYKYGWRQAPQEILARSGTVGRFLWGWARTREIRAASPSPAPARARSAPRTTSSHARLRQPGDVNLSTLLSVLAIAGIALAVTV